MASIGKPPCDEGVVLAGPCAEPCEASGERWVLAATVLGSGMAFLDGTVVNIALPVLQRELSASVSQIQWVVEAYTLMLASLLLAGGSLGDRFGRRRVFSIGVAVFAAASVACGSAQSVEQLVAARAAQGVGGALLVPGSLAILSASFDRERRGRAIGVWSGFSAMSAGLGLLLGGWMLDVASWRALFFLNVPLAAATFAITRRWVSESRDEGLAAPLDVRGALLATAGLAAVTFGLVESSSRGWSAPEVPGSLALGAVLIAAFLRAESRAVAPMLPLTLFRSPVFAGANLMTLCLYAGLAGAMFFLPLNLIQVQGYSAAEAGAANVPFILLMFFLSRWAGGLADRFGSRPPLVVGPLVAAAGLLLFARPGVGGSYWTTFFPPVALLGLGMAISVAPLTNAVMGAVESRSAGLASGVNNAASRLAAVLAIALLGPVAVLAHRGSLAGRLEDLAVDAELRDALLARSAHLGAAEVPASAPEAARAALAGALDQAFVDAWRVVVTLAAALAVLASLVAALYVPPAPDPAEADATARA